MAMRIQVLDPPAYTPPYDHALCAALARSGGEVELVTSRFPYGPVPTAHGYRVSESFYPRSARLRGARARRAGRAAEHVPGMLARRRGPAPDVRHWQWLTLPQIDTALLPPGRPQLLTAHDILPREPRPGQVAATRRALQRMDAVVVHSEHGAARLRDEAGADPECVHVIPHGAFHYLTDLPDERPLPPELQRVEGPVVLCFGLLRGYKGIDLLLEAFRDIEGAELWIVGMPRIPLAPLRELAGRCRSPVRFVDRFVTEPEIPAFFRRADLVVLPYREIDQSGVLYTALAFGKPLLLTSVGGFVEVAAHGAAALVPPEDPPALATALDRLVQNAPERERLAAAASAAAAGPYSWDTVGERTMALYRKLGAA